ncbi:ABC transporter permease [Estrella lausannensis]|uniref:ABC transporter, permease n=1 Tax=Estrella lausannensis TaxID=483423 RepID=A0A0H5DPK0_9BACT|nr:FtsX-like permease family protein [Estrella lausannensis]CRX38496.1 ABC transporter, permease [Estrella lausannensis]
MRFFELSVALKYIKPDIRQLSVSIISMISVLVISLVVWLVVVFLSISWGLEKGWVAKLITLSAPVRVVPTDAYYQSYYYLADSISSGSNYAPKTLGEKLIAEKADPYDPEWDQEIPAHFPKPDLDASGSLKDLIQIAFREIDKVREATPYEYQKAVSAMSLKMFRRGASEDEDTVAFLNQNVYVGSLEGSGVENTQVILKPKEDDIRALMTSFSYGFETPDGAWLHANQPLIEKRLSSWEELLEKQKSGTSGTLANPFFFELSKEHSILRDSLATYGERAPEAILVPKIFKESGVRMGDRGHLNYFAPSADGPRELKMPVIVAGFYDPGIIPLGGRFILTRKEVVSLLQASVPDDMRHEATGIGVNLTDIAVADHVKEEILARFQAQGITPYFRVETYKEYDYAKDIILQLQSEKNLFTMLAVIILIVACSNIVSMLIILVNDKKTEIGILRSMGATSLSIASIFGATGIFLGISGSIIGISLAILTLNNLDSLIALITRMQGYEMFNPQIYGEALPSELSVEALLFVVFSTAFISLIAGTVPACKACLLKPSEILKAE